MTPRGPIYRGRSGGRARARAGAVHVGRRAALDRRAARARARVAATTAAEPGPRASSRGSCPAAARRSRRSRSSCPRSRRPIRSRFDAQPDAVLARARRLIPRLAGRLRARARPAPARAARSRRGDPARALASPSARPGPSARSRSSNLALVLLRRSRAERLDVRGARGCVDRRRPVRVSRRRGRGALAARCTAARASRSRCSRARPATPAGASSAVHDRMRRGERIPGFGHVLYPDGDPRAAPLLEAASALAPRAPRVRTIAAHRRRDGRGRARQAQRRRGARRGLRRARPAARAMGPAIFAIGRSAGWVAHILEQYEAGFVLRPRARFIGGL